MLGPAGQSFLYAIVVVMLQALLVLLRNPGDASHQANLRT